MKTKAWIALVFVLFATSASAVPVRKQSSTSNPVPFQMVLTSDHVSAATGLTVTATCSLNGGAFGACNGAVAEVGSGIYTLAGDATDRGTLGTLVIKATGTAADTALVSVEIVAYDPFAADLGLSNVSANVTQISGDSGAADNLETATDGGAYNVGGGSIVAASVTGAVGSVTGAVGSVTGNVGGNVNGTVASVVGNVGGNVTGSVGSVAAGGITSSSFGTGAIDADALATDAADEVATQVWASGTRTITGGTVTTVSDKTGYALSAAGVDAVWDEPTPHNTAGTMGALLTAISAPTAADIWTYATRSLTTYGTLVADIETALSDVDVTVSSPVASDGDLEIIPGDAYDIDHGRQIDIAITGAPSLVGATVVLVIDGAGLTITATSVATAGSATQTPRFELLASQTDDLTKYGTTAYRYQVQATWAADTPAQPAVLVRGDVSTIRRAAP